MNFGFASLINACITIYHPEFSASAWQLLLIFYAICLGTLLISIYLNRLLPYVDILSAAFTALTIFIVLIALSVKAGVGRHSVTDTLGAYDKSFSGYGGFTFFIGLLPVSKLISRRGNVLKHHGRQRIPFLR